MGNKIRVRADGKEVVLSNLEKVFWPDRGFTKADLLRYYSIISPYLLPHLRGRPMVMSRYPEGIEGNSFYQKEAPEYIPEWLPTVPLPAAGKRKVINYVLVEDLAGLLWVVNQGAIEMHPWLSQFQQPDYPTAAILDLDPAPPAGFAETRRLALLLRPLLSKIGLKAYPKTSGATGLHLYIPVAGRYTYTEVRAALTNIAEVALRAWPELVTLERTVRLRTGHVYIDVSQNGRGKTIASVYSVRPLPGAPVSLPLSWADLENTRLEPGQFHILNVPDKVTSHGDLFAPVLNEAQNLEPLLGSIPAVPETSRPDGQAAENRQPVIF